MIGASVKPIIALVNILKDPEFFTSDTDRLEVVTNGLKALRLLSSEKPNAQKLIQDYNLMLKHVLDILEECANFPEIMEEGTELVTNLTRF